MDVCTVQSCIPRLCGLMSPDNRSDKQAGPRNRLLCSLRFCFDGAPPASMKATLLERPLTFEESHPPISKGHRQFERPLAFTRTILSKRPHSIRALPRALLENRPPWEQHQIPLIDCGLLSSPSTSDKSRLFLLEISLAFFESRPPLPPPSFKSCPPSTKPTPLRIHHRTPSVERRPILSPS